MDYFECGNEPLGSIKWGIFIDYLFEEDAAPVGKVKKEKSKVHPCTGTEALYRPYGPWGE